MPSMEQAINRKLNSEDYVPKKSLIKASAAADFTEVESDDDGESIFSEDDLPDYLK
mgnify:CR=1 FL=1